MVSPSTLDFHINLREGGVCETLLLDPLNLGKEIKF